jgi:hypothetical protein
MSVPEPRTASFSSLKVHACESVTRETGANRSKSAVFERKIGLCGPPKDGCPHEFPSENWESEDEQDAVCWFLGVFGSNGSLSLVVIFPSLHQGWYFRFVCCGFFPSRNRRVCNPNLQSLLSPTHSAAVSRIFLVSPIVLARCCVHRRPEYTDATRADFHFHCSSPDGDGGPVWATAEAGGGQDAANHLDFSKRNESADNAPEACARRYAICRFSCLGKSSGCVTIAKSIPCCDFNTAQPVVASCPYPEETNENSMSTSTRVR